MMKLTRLLCLCLSVFLGVAVAAQPEKSPPKPYKIMSSSKQLIIKSSKNIKHIMLWTTGGNRVSEHKDINATQYVLEITAPQKTFFLMIALDGGKIYTEKIGLR